MLVEAGGEKCRGCRSSTEARAEVAGPVRLTREAFTARERAEQGIDDGLENDSLWAEGKVGAKAGTMILRELRVFIRGPKIDYAPGHALSGTFVDSQSQEMDLDNFNWEPGFFPWARF